MSENIFTEIYNKILGLFGQSAVKDDSKDVAVNRLRLVLMQDRTNLTPEIMHRMRTELIEVLSKYVELDKEALELNFEQEGEQMALMLSIPVVRAKDEKEIEEALKKDDEAKSLKEKDEESEKTEEEPTEDETENSEEEEETENKDNIEKTSEEEPAKVEEGEEKEEIKEDSETPSDAITELYAEMVEDKPKTKKSKKVEE